MSVISQNLLRIRTGKGMTQQQVADKSGISRTAYRNIESGMAKLKVNTLINITNALGTKLVEVFSEPHKLTKVKWN